ncbi:MAG: hypothetical protein WBD20_02860 [Pirellulaceae bacterium]
MSTQNPNQLSLLSDVSVAELQHVNGGLELCPVQISQLNANLTSRYAEWVYKLKNLKFVLPDFPR